MDSQYLYQEGIFLHLAVRASPSSSYVLLHTSPGETGGGRKVFTRSLLSHLALGSLSLAIGEGTLLSFGCFCGFLEDSLLELSIRLSQDSGSASLAGCYHLPSASDFHSDSLLESSHPQAE